jgi:large subunit ribosomal protein L19
MNAIAEVTAHQMRDVADEFKVGDTVRIDYRIIEGKTERVQAYEGVCIAFKGKGIARTCTIRKISYGVGVERIFPIHSPRIDKVDVVRRGRVRRAKLYYLRDRSGKAAKVDELIVRKKPAADAKAKSSATSKSG